MGRLTIAFATELANVPSKLPLAAVECFETDWPWPPPLRRSVPSNESTRLLIKHGCRTAAAFRAGQETEDGGSGGGRGRSPWMKEKGYLEVVGGVGGGASDVETANVGS